ncbi:hypothetical protein NQD34_013667 [Periophthalmus magnuspinnatus]|uniref:uncharacterized protein sb:cb1058 n=1 Tax=Periophthalmus magnuspinnatus TaxID=409849 RepID=UPI00145A653A|nr:uncharacterized protein sb:cb1058 [Periophthalmus magnuspinnatus]KAJ0006394.1 hypothetical protein NQD34_013667 [Periophthalmus magnuspinnatus]
MTIGQRKSFVRSSIRATKFLDKASGFYGRLDEPEIPTVVEDLKVEFFCGALEEVEMFNEDDGEMLLRRKPSRCSSRWRNLRGKESKEERKQSEEERRQGSQEITEVMIQVQLYTEEREPAVVHFAIPEVADDKVLIMDKAEQEVREQPEEQMPEEERQSREQEEGFKALKKKSSKNYHKALDRAFRRGWEAFITNLYSVTLISSSDSSPSSPSLKKRQHSSVRAEMH